MGSLAAGYSLRSAGASSLPSPRMQLSSLPSFAWVFVSHDGEGLSGGASTTGRAAVMKGVARHER